MLFSQYIYTKNGLHLITGACSAVDDPFHRAEADDAFGYDTILSGDAGRYCITRYPPFGNCVPPNGYPAVNDRVIVYSGKWSYNESSQAQNDLFFSFFIRFYSLKRRHVWSLHGFCLIIA